MVVGACGIAALLICMNNQAARARPRRKGLALAPPKPAHY